MLRLVPLKSASISQTFTRLLLRCVLCCISLLAAPATFADDFRLSTVITGDQQDESLFPALFYVEDAAHRLDSSADPESFKSLPWHPAGAALGRGGTSRSQWLLRTTLNNVDNVERLRVLAILNPTLDEVVLTLTCNNGQTSTATSGDIHPLSVRPLPNRYPSFPLVLPANTACTAWLFINTADSFQVPVRILDLFSFNGLVMEDFLLRILGLGMQLLIVLMATVIALNHRHGLAAYFAFTVASQAFLVLVLTDLGYALLWGEAPYLQKILAPSAIWLGWALTQGVCLRLLPEDAINRVAVRILQGSMLLALVAAALQVISPHPSHMGWLVALCAFGMLLLLAITAGAVLLGAAHAGLVTAGIMAITLGGLIEASGFLGLLPLGTYYMIPLHTGFLVSAALFGISISYNLDATQQRRSSDREVNRRVAERTHVLSSTLAELVRTNRQLDHISRSDGLTGTFNRRYMDHCLQRYALDEHLTPLSFILFDIDFFKQVNDNHGHGVGDQCLRTVADCVQEQLRQDKDVLCRYGGEEFAVILPNTNMEGAIRVAEKIRLAVAGKTMRGDKGDVLRVTISLGVSTLWQTGSPMQLVESADKALYRAKRDGRNRWKVAAA